jgi:hypothetical protein
MRQGATLKVTTSQQRTWTRKMIFEVTVFWEGEFFAHDALTYRDALEWAEQYRRPADESCKIRVWFKRNTAE